MPSRMSTDNRRQIVPAALATEMSAGRSAGRFHAVARSGGFVPKKRAPLLRGALSGRSCERSPTRLFPLIMTSEERSPEYNARMLARLVSEVKGGER